MRLLKKSIHPSLKNLEQKKTVRRLATRSIALKGEDILLLYTKRYDDYSLPGGGVDPGEEIKTAMVRELQEETGAKNIRDIKEFGIYEGFRPWSRDGFEVMHMISYCYTCVVDHGLGEVDLEDYEISNGMKPVWVNIYKALEHNEKASKNQQKAGLSIERETFLLKLIIAELL